MTTASTPTTAAPLLVGLVGPAGVGKDTVAAYMDDQYGFAPLAMARPVKAMIEALWAEAELDPRWLTDRALKEQPSPLGPSYRQLMQGLGTWGRDVSTQFWVRIAQHKALLAIQRGDNVVITDVRFANEAQWITDAGGVLVRIYRDTAQPVHPHASERELYSLTTQHEIWNTASKATLYDQVDRLMTELRAERVA